MVHLNMNVNIDVFADDNISELNKKQVIEEIENAIFDLFECPISVGAILKDYNIMTDGNDKEYAYK